ncbi:MAG: hypothetical protein B7Y70_10210 [Rhizobiales bacterium 35-68-8]|nr:MAG: hypothetical protein B7Y70_10210 [Rhizobiales bacterium 35-68-8]
MRRAFIALSLAAVSAAPAFAQEQKTWSTFDTDKGAVLGFGVPETDDTVVTFTCERGNPVVLVSSRVGSKGLKANDAAKIILTTGKVKKEFAGKGIANEESAAVDVDAGGKLADIKAVLTGGKSMTLEVKGVKLPVSLDGAADSYAQFEASCQ